MNNFFLIRHAEAIWSEDENRLLSDRGRQDAERVAEILVNFPVDLIYSSPYKRARETIFPLSERSGLAVQIEPNLRERVLSSEIVKDFYPAVKQNWADPDFAHPGGESNSTVQKRGLAVLSLLKDDEKSNQIVISSHGNLLAVLLQHFDPSLGYEFWKSMTFPDIYMLKIASDGDASILRLWE